MLEDLNFHFGIYDWLLVFMVTALGTLSAYLKDPQLKAVTATIPIPCGFAYIAVGLPMGTENAVSGFMCMLYVHIVRLEIIIRNAKGIGYGTDIADAGSGRFLHYISKLTC